MSEQDYSKTGPSLRALVPGHIPTEMTEEERDKAIEVGAPFAKAVAVDSSDACLIIVGEFVPPDYPVRAAEAQVLECCLDAFDYQVDQQSNRRINVLLDSTGGSLDSAFKIVRYLTWYTDELNVYVPREAKSASTLIALGAHRIYLSPFGELGPLDTQIPDPRNPTTFVSALDCYQSVDYVRKFGVETMSQALRRLGEDARSQIAFVDMISAASSFGSEAIRPMLEGVRALDFGAWGRSLQIGEKYARQILQDNKTILIGDRSLDLGTSVPASNRPDRASEIANRLVYGYHHHFFPVDYREIKDIGLEVKIMNREVYEAATAVLDEAEGKSFIDFVSDDEKKRRKQKHQRRLDEAAATEQCRSFDGGAPESGT